MYDDYVLKNLKVYNLYTLLIFLKKNLISCNKI